MEGKCVRNHDCRADPSKRSRGRMKWCRATVYRVEARGRAGETGVRMSGKGEGLTEWREIWMCISSPRGGREKCRGERRVSGRAVCSPLLWVGLPGTNTHIPHKLKHSHMICVTMKSGDWCNKWQIGSTAGVRVKNKECWQASNWGNSDDVMVNG